MEKTPSKLVPAIIGGSVMGVLSTIPFINLGNCFCCMWLLLGGAVAAYFYSKELPPDSEFATGEGAIVGLLAGVFGALFGTFLGYLFMAMGMAPGRELLTSILESQGDISPDLRDILDQLQNEGNLSPLFVFIGLFFNLILDSLFGMVGGIIGAAILRKRLQKNAQDVTGTS